MQIKDLGVVLADRRDSPDGFLVSDLPPIFSLRLCVEAFFPLFPPPKSAL
jgi:hypothetical protein